MIVDDDGESAGTIGIWETEHAGAVVHETGRMLLVAFHGRGLAGAAPGQLLERALRVPDTYSG